MPKTRDVSLSAIGNAAKRRRLVGSTAARSAAGKARRRREAVALLGPASDGAESYGTDDVGRLASLRALTKRQAALDSSAFIQERQTLCRYVRHAYAHYLRPHRARRVLAG